MSITPEQVEQIPERFDSADAAGSSPHVPTPWVLSPSPFHRDAGLFSYTAGVLGAVAFTALAIGPGWVGFLIAFLPASLFATWAVSANV